MHFKSLELSGFKSFADRTRFDFEPGVTAVIGPNGCGKSNIADAIRWVLGEQNARLLRGQKMEDVIFSGSDLRKPLGLADVSLTLSGVDAVLPVDYREITVTRRVFRSGEGQYLINKNACRLRDIDDLFTGTGIGLSAYSIMEQGKMDMVLSSKPEDRRFIFEEAAGITKYKEKKREALRKFEATEENLVRLSDIIKEVRRQLASVERQASRARRARETGDRLKEIELQFAAKRLSDLDAALRAVEETRDAARRDEDEAARNIGELEAEGKALHAQLRSLDEELGTVQARRMGVSGTIESSRTRIETNGRQIREIEEREGVYARELDALKIAQAALEQEEGGLAAARGAAAEECRAAADDLDAAAKACEELRIRLQESEERAQRQRGELIELINLNSKHRNELSGLRYSARTAALRGARLGVEERELAEKVQRARQMLQEKGAGRERLAAAREEGARGLERAQTAAEDARREAEGVREELLRREKELACCESERGLIARYRASYEGYAGGVRAVMEEAGREGSGLAGIIGAVGEKVKARPGCERALEAALGHSLQHILTRSVGDARNALAFLGDRADAGFLPCDGLAPAAGVGAPRGDGLLGRALDHVSCDPAFAPAAVFLLGATWFVRDLDSAAALLGACAPGGRLATLSGELLVAGGPIETVGRGRGASPLITRDRELEQLSARTETLRMEREGLLAVLNASDENRRGLEGALGGARETLRQREIELAEARAEESQAAGDLGRLDAELKAVRGESAELENQRSESAIREGQLDREIAENEEREKALQDSLSTAQAGTETGERELEGRQAAVVEMKMRRASAEAREHGLRTDLDRAKREIAKNREAIAARSAQREREGARRAELISEIEDLRRSMEALIAERDMTETDAREREGRKAALYDRQRELDDLLREKVASMGAVKDRVAQLSVALAEQRGERNRVIERVRDGYGEDLAVVRVEPGAADWAAVEGEIGELREKLHRIGPVNMVALEEHEELAGRLNFLTTQEADLIAAKESLGKAIARINAETTRMFSQTFEKIRGNFKEIYRELFGGGNADLVLEEGVDVLEAGINIVARPPGKKLQALSLLSGGEKALTAVALLFAIFKVRPSPFCVLDEIDAPLDESNINRFLAMLGQFLMHTQFIIVTHNKRTISMADVMYGITMEESGVSKVVSVKFGKGHKKGGARAEARGGSARAGDGATPGAAEPVHELPGTAGTAPAQNPGGAVEERMKAADAGEAPQEQSPGPPPGRDGEAVEAEAGGGDEGG
ncbi:MAG: chromosome segregation protein SMC [Chlamydiota bacterium]